MMRSFYRKRWEMYFDYLRHQFNGDPEPAPDFFAWERAWVTHRQKTKL
jgi:alpha-N-acetylglucosaminidase